MDAVVVVLMKMGLMIWRSRRRVGGRLRGRRWLVRGRTMRWNLVFEARAFFARLRGWVRVSDPLRWIVWVERDWGRFREGGRVLGVECAKMSRRRCCRLLG